MREQIHYLKQEEKQNSRKMYETVFPEDSVEFVDYYYQWKVRDNKILVMEDETGYEVMMHLNPYRLKANGKSVVVPYIVAVATRENCRRKGKMQQVMKQALQDLQKIHCPFTFLLPADPAYYYGQGFVFAVKLPLKKKEVQKPEGVQNVRKESCFSVKQLKSEQLEQIAETANEILAKQYCVYVQREASYYERQIAETAGEHGEVLVVEADGRIIGILSYGKGEQAEVKEFLLMHQYEGQREEICNQIFGLNGWSEEIMQMMFRITDLQSLSGMLKGKTEEWIVRVRDSNVEENNGIWKLKWNPQGGNIVRLAEEISEADVEEVDIVKVTERIVEKWRIFIREWV